MDTVDIYLDNSATTALSPMARVAMLEAMECSTPYCNNAQVVVTK